MPWMKALIEKVSKKFHLKSSPSPFNQEPPVSEAQTEREALVARLIEHLRACYKEWETNVWYLDHRHEHFAEETKEWYARHEAQDPTNETIDQLEQRQFQTTQQLTRLVIEAEKALDKAEAEVAAAGIEVLSPEWGSKCGEDDEYTISGLLELCEPGEDYHVLKWLRDVPDSRQGDNPLLSAFDPPDHAVEIDTWYGPEPEMWESGSQLADGRERKKIDRWRRQVAAVVRTT